MGIVLRLNDDLYINPDQIACIEIIRDFIMVDHGMLFNLPKRKFQVALGGGKELILTKDEEVILRNYYHEQGIFLNRD